MSGIRVLGRFRSPAVAAPDLPTTPPARHPRARRLLRAAVDGAVVAVLAAILLIGAGLAGTPWYRFVSVEGGSMAPAIGRGDLILVAPAPAKVEPGMILVLRVGGALVTHRVVAVNPDGTFVTRGDANTVNDAWGGQRLTVEGEYLATVPVLGNVLRVGSRSEASFTDAVNAGMTITVRPFPPPVACPLADFGYDASGAQPYALLTVHVWAKGTLPANCALSFSLNSYTSEGRTGPALGRRPCSTTRPLRSTRPIHQARSQWRSRPATARPTSTPAPCASTASTARCPTTRGQSCRSRSWPGPTAARPATA